MIVTVSAYGISGAVAVAKGDNSLTEGISGRPTWFSRSVYVEFKRWCRKF